VTVFIYDRIIEKYGQKVVTVFLEKTVKLTVFRVFEHYQDDRFLELTVFITRRS
jgi:hypothetical protein